MDVILKQDVERLGAKNDIVTVKTGYARNYLIPKDSQLQQPKAHGKWWLKPSASNPTKP